MHAALPEPPERGPVALATSPARLVGEVLLALPYVVRQVPPLVQDARTLVGELTRLARGADEGALTDVVGELARLASEDGELTLLLRETARLSAAKAAETRPAAAPAPTPLHAGAARG